MATITKPLFDQAYRDILEKTRQAEARQRRILRYRLLIWCLPWCPPAPFVLILTGFMLEGRGGAGAWALVATLVMPVLAILAMIDHRMKCDADLEQGDSGVCRWIAIYSVSQLGIALAILLLLQCHRIGDTPCHSRLPSPDHRHPPVKRTMLRTY